MSVALGAQAARLRKVLRQTERPLGPGGTDDRPFYYQYLIMTHVKMGDPDVVFFWFAFGLQVPSKGGSLKQHTHTPHSHTTPHSKMHHTPHNSTQHTHTHGHPTFAGCGHESKEGMMKVTKRGGHYVLTATISGQLDRVSSVWIQLGQGGNSSQILGCYSRLEGSMYSGHLGSIYTRNLP